MILAVPHGRTFPHPIINPPYSSLRNLCLLGKVSHSFQRFVQPLSDQDRCSNLLILDPTQEESSIATGTLTLTLNAQRELCVLSKAGGTPLTVEDVMKVVNIGVDVVREMNAEIEEAIKKDEAVRVVDVR